MSHDYRMVQAHRAPREPGFPLAVDGGDQVRMSSASRVERVGLERVAATLGLLVPDEQSLEMRTG